MDVIMDIEKSRKFYQDRYNKAIKQFGSNSLTASICRKKLELLDTKTKQNNDVSISCKPEPNIKTIKTES